MLPNAEHVKLSGAKGPHVKLQLNLFISRACAQESIQLMFSTILALIKVKGI